MAASVQAQDRESLEFRRVSPIEGAQPAVSECLPLFVELEKYFVGKQARVGFREVERNSEEIASLPDLLTFETTSLEINDDNTSTAAFSIDKNILDPCSAALDNMDHSPPPQNWSINPSLDESVQPVLSRMFSWGLVDAKLRWTLGAARDVRLRSDVDAKFIPRQPAVAEDKAPIFGDGEQVIPAASLEASDDTSQSWILLSLAAFATISILSVFTAFVAAQSQRRELQKVAATLAEESERIMDFAAILDDGARTSLGRIEARFRTVIENIEGMLPETATLASARRQEEGSRATTDPQPLVSEQSEFVLSATDRAPEQRPVGKRSTRRTRSFLERFGAGGDVSAIVSAFNSYIVSGEKFDEIAESKRLMLYVSDRIADGQSHRLLLRDYEDASNRENATFWVGRGTDGDFFALPGPDVVKVVRHPSFLRERVRGYFRADEGGTRRFQVVEPCWLRLTSDSLLEVERQGRLLSPN